MGLFQVTDNGKPKCYLYSNLCILADLCHLLFVQESEVLSMSGMESFIEKQTKLLQMQPAEVPDKEPQQVPKESVDSGLLDKAVVSQELNKNDPGEWQDLCFHSREQRKCPLGLRVGRLCSADLCSTEIHMLKFSRVGGAVVQK